MAGEDAGSSSQGPPKCSRTDGEWVAFGSKGTREGKKYKSINCYKRALEIRIGQFGEGAPECVNAYLEYESALQRRLQELTRRRREVAEDLEATRISASSPTPAPNDKAEVTSASPMAIDENVASRIAKAGGNNESLTVPNSHTDQGIVGRGIKRVSESSTSDSSPTNKAATNPPSNESSASDSSPTKNAATNPPSNDGNGTAS